MLPNRFLLQSAHLTLAIIATASIARAQRPIPSSTCATVSGRSSRTARQLLERADSVMGMTATRERQQVLRYRATVVRSWAYQSDKQYAPYLFSSAPVFEWFSPSTGALATSVQVLQPGAQPHDVGFAYASYGPVHDTIHTQTGDRVTATRNLNPWATVTDWLHGPAVRVAGRCSYRDYTRDVIARTGPGGDEYLLLDPKSGFPVKLDRTEHQYLWGDTHVEYVYTTWSQGARSSVYFPTGSFRSVDGEQDAAWMTFGVGAIAADSAPNLSVADTTPAAALGQPLFLRATPVDTVRVGPQTFLLSNYGYTQGVVLAHDTIFLLDATQGEERAKLDSAWIGRLFPGRHPVALVVTDLAWPHIAGVRYWAANGATIYTHRTSEQFLRRVLARPWTIHPDVAQRRRATMRPVIRTVGDSLRLAGGAVRLYAIDGIASEGALMAYDESAKFLWGSDYIQGVGAPSLYASEVWRAAQRAGLHPQRVAAQHQRLVDWSAVEAIAR